jgi:hypothetical protein
LRQVLVKAIVYFEVKAINTEARSYPNGRVPQHLDQAFVKAVSEHARRPVGIVKIVATEELDPPCAAVGQPDDQERTHQRLDRLLDHLIALVSGRLQVVDLDGVVAPIGYALDMSIVPKDGNGPAGVQG